MLSLRINYEEFCSSQIDQKKQLILDNILNSLLVIKKKLKSNFDYEGIKADIFDLIS